MTDVSDEQKIVFQEGNDIRKLQGVIVSEDADFFYLSRKDGNYRIGKRFVIKIEPDKKQNTLGGGSDTKV